MTGEGHPRTALGVDIGGTNLAFVLLDTTGKVVARHLAPTNRAETPEMVVGGFTRHLEAGLHADTATLSAVGVGVAAQVRKGTGEVIFAPNLGWRDVPLRHLVEQGLRHPCVVVNDVQAATYAELTAGEGQGQEDIAVLRLGTGVGGGVVLSGKLLEGSSGTAGEFGHLTIVSGGRRCPCGGAGCLEAYVSGSAIGQRAREAFADEPSKGAGLKAAAGGTDHIDARSVGRAYRFRDPLAVELVQETAAYLAAGIVSVVNGLNPSVVVLAGGVIDGIPDLASLAEARVRELALPAATGHLKVVRSSLGEYAGAVGAAALALAKHATL
jgi:glucokinase